MNVRKVIDVVRREHDLRLSPDDPILVSGTIAEEALQDAIKAIDGIVKAGADRTTAASVQATAEAKKAAGVIISDASKWLGDRFREDAKAAVTPLLQELQAERGKVAELAKAAKRAGWIAGGCAAFTAAALAGWMINALSMVFR